MIGGLTGSQRVGKTTLATAYAEKVGGVLVACSTGETIASLGLDPTKPMSFDDRMRAQEAVLDYYVSLYERSEKFKTICVFDRTPIDLIAYALSDVTGSMEPSKEGTERLNRYINRCYEVANRYFSFIVHVQPGIEIVDAPLKASTDPRFIEKMNTLVAGILCDQRNRVPDFTIPRAITSLEERIKAMEFAQKKSIAYAERDLSEYRSQGYLVH